MTTIKTQRNNARLFQRNVLGSKLEDREFMSHYPFFVTFSFFFTARKFCKLLFTTERGKVCYSLLLFLLLVTLIYYFLLLKRARVYIVFIV